MLWLSGDKAIPRRNRNELHGPGSLISQRLAARPVADIAVPMSTQTLPVINYRQRLTYDRRFYLSMAIASTVLVFVGFSPTYYLKFHYPMSRELSILVHVHGLVFTLWMLYFIGQTALIAVNRPALHRKLGIAGTFLAALMVGLGLAVAFSAVRLHHGAGPYAPETIFFVALCDLATFVLFFVTGFLWRRNRETHQRLMLLTVTAGLIGPALGRLGLLGVPGPAVGLTALAFLLAGPIYDLITRRRIHPAYVYGVLFSLLTFPPIRFLVGATPWWHRIAHSIAGM